ncbi:hypothetical protein A5810_003072 [Enterococcus faecium]|uniref:Resolvase/invertase-type recombinase catalytic domain-containing protein n=1 Tax=Enterococcus faecium TaxID=1352 RepID=A0A242AS58_ENTFC|nr:hypothetical protein A5810_003072 [Enterococcus faecium]
MAKISYVRVSIQDQKLDRQVIILDNQKIDKWLQEKASGKDCERPEIQKSELYSRRRLCDRFFLRLLRKKR